jgi:hypothetical protein
MLLQDLMMAGQTPWAKAYQHDQMTPGSMMAQLAPEQIMKLLGMNAPAMGQPAQPAPPPPQAAQPGTNIAAVAPQGGSGVLQQYGAGSSFQPAPDSDVKVSDAPMPSAGGGGSRTPLPPPATEPTAPKRVPGTPRRPNFSDQTGFSDVAGALMQGAGGILGPIGQLVGGSGARREEATRKNMTYDWLIRQGASPEDAEFIVRTPEALKGILSTKFGGGKDIPSAVREWKYYNSLSEEDRRRYLTMKRADKWLDTGTSFVNPNAAQPGAAPTASVLKDPAGKAAATERGKYEGGEEKRKEGKQRLTTILGGLAKDYMELDKTGGVVNPDKGVMENLAARGKSSGVGQFIAGATGAKEQSIRQQINNSRPLLIQGIMQATGMSARALDSNKELEFYLQAVTNPQSDLHSNLIAIDAIDKTYGLGGVLQRVLPKEVYEKVSRDAARQLQTRPIPKPEGESGETPATPNRFKYNPATGELE